MHRVSKSGMEVAAPGLGPQARPQGRPGNAAELGPEVARAAPPEGVRAARAARSARTSCAAPEARVGH